MTGTYSWRTRLALVVSKHLVLLSLKIKFRVVYSNPFHNQQSKATHINTQINK